MLESRVTIAPKRNDAELLLTGEENAGVQLLLHNLPSSRRNSREDDTVPMAEDAPITLATILEQQRLAQEAAERRHLEAMQAMMDAHRTALRDERDQAAKDLANRETAHNAHTTALTTELGNVTRAVADLTAAAPPPAPALSKIAAPPMPPAVDKELKVDDAELDSLKKILHWREVYASLFRRYEAYALQLAHHYKAGIESTLYKAFPQVAAHEAGLRINNRDRLEEFSDTLFASLRHSIVKLFDTHKMDVDFVIPDPVVLKFPTDPNNHIGRRCLAENGINKHYVAAMTLIENDLYAQLASIVKASRHATVVQSYSARKHGTLPDHTRVPAQDADVWHADALQDSLLRTIPSNGSAALRWLDVRLDPSNKFARLEKQIEAFQL